MSSVPKTLLSEASPSVGGRTKYARKRVRKTGRSATAIGSRRKSSKRKAAIRRTSEILREIISDKSHQVLTMEQILKVFGPTSFGGSQMVFSIPEVLQITLPGLTTAMAIPTDIISSQLTKGRREIRLPDTLLKRAIPRKAFAAAVRAILPFLERAERGTRARWRWASTVFMIELLPEEHVIRPGFVEGAEAAYDAWQKAKASKEVTIPKDVPAKRTMAISREENKSGQKAIAPVIERLKTWREANSLSRSQAVKLLNLAGLPAKVRTLQGWEIGRQPQAMTAAALERFLDQQSNHLSIPA